MARVQRVKNVQLSIEMVVVQKLILLLIVPATTYFQGPRIVTSFIIPIFIVAVNVRVCT